MEEKSIEFNLNCNVGVDYTAKKLFKNFDYICLTGGAEAARDLVCENRNIEGTHQRAASVTQLEILPKPPGNRSEDNQWPRPPHLRKKAVKECFQLLLKP